MKALRIASLMLALAGVVLLTGCNRIADPMAGRPEPTDVRTCTWAHTTTLYAGQTIPIGYVNIGFTYNWVTINYEITDPEWWLDEAHADIKLQWESIPQNNGNAVPGQFAYKQDPIDPVSQNFSFTIPNTAEWRDAAELYIAAHCHAIKIVDGQQVQEETGWGDGEDFPGHDWDMYIVFKGRKVIHLPDVKVGAQYSKVLDCTYGYAPIEFHIWNVPGDPGDFNIWDGYWPTFCFDLHTYLYGVGYEAWLWDSYDPNLPTYARCYRSDGVTPVPYDKINYLLNEYGPPPYDNRNAVAIQQACWYYRGYLTYAQLNADAQAMVDLADSKGVGFYPAIGQYLCVLIDIDKTIQLCGLVLDP